MTVHDAWTKALLTAGCIVLGAWSFLFTVAQVTSLPLASGLVRSPAADGRQALERISENGLRNASDRETVAAQARRALAGTPNNPRAATALALATGGTDAPAARRLLRYSEKLSRRLEATELAMIELSSASGDVADTLLHYDRAMRVSLPLRDALFPILVVAVSDPAIRPDVKRLVARSPDWGASYLDRLISTSTDRTAITDLMLAKADDSSAEGRQRVASALLRLVDLGAPAYARLLYRRACLADICFQTPVNGDFARPPSLPPFDWQLIGDISSVTIDTNDAGRPALLVGPQANGAVARQLLTLAAGRYALNGAVGGSGDAPAAVAIRCWNGGAQLVDASPRGNDRFLKNFIVPDACPFQWLTISRAPSADPAASPAWINSLNIRATQRPA